MPTPDVIFRQWLGLGHIDDEAGDKATQVESVIEPVRKGIKVGMGVFAELQRLEGTGQHGLQIAEHGVVGIGSCGWALEHPVFMSTQIKSPGAQRMSLLRQVSNQIA